MLIEKMMRITIIKLRNIGLWNCTPHPIFPPMTWIKKSNPFKVHINVIIPSADEINLRRILILE